MIGTNELLIGFLIILVFMWCSSKSENMTSAEVAVSVPNDWNQYIRDEAQRIVYLPNHIYRGGYCFPELVGWPAGDAAAYIKNVDPRLYTDIIDERVPKRNDIYYSQPRRVNLYIDSRGLVSRIPLSG